MAAFTATLAELITNVSSIATFFVDMFVDIADMLFNSPFVIFIGLSICIAILGTVAGYLRIRRGGRKRR